VIEDSGTAAPHAAIPFAGGNDARPTAAASRANEVESAIATGSAGIENATRRFA
jgi:hypothetical protein